MIDEILPATVACSEAFHDIPDAQLYPEEIERIARAVPRRRGEYATARHCARRALAALGVTPVAIPTGDKGAPRWPAGIVGTITHCTGYRAAAVARTRDIASIGIDAEPHDVLPTGVLPSISLPPEQRHLAELASLTPDIHWDRLLFCAKEAVYKAWFPLMLRWLGFSDVQVTFCDTRSGGDSDNGVFSAQLMTPVSTAQGRRLTSFDGRWLVRDGLIATVVTVQP